MSRTMNETPKKPRRAGAARLPWHIAQAMEAIVEYLFDDEFTDYQARPKQERNGHVFRDLLRVKGYLTKIGVVTEKQGS